MSTTDGRVYKGVVFLQTNVSDCLQKPTAFGSNKTVLVYIEYEFETIAWPSVSVYLSVFGSVLMTSVPTRTETERPDET